MGRVMHLLRYEWGMHFASLVTNWLPDNVPFLSFRGWLAAHFLGSCGKRLRLGRDVTMYNPAVVHFADDIYVAHGCCFMANATIHVGSEVMFGPYCVVASANHTRARRSFRFGPIRGMPVVIGAGTWLAAHVTVTAGARIGQGSMVAANAVVTERVPDDVIAGGVPARVMRSIAPDEAC